MFLQQIVNGLTIGGIYALIAMGLALVYGILRIIHVAHAGVYVVGAYIGLYTFLSTNSFVLAVLASMASGAIVGVFIQKYVYLSLLKHSPIISLIASIGVFIAIEEGLRLIFGPYIKSFPSDLFNAKYHIGSIVIGQSQLIVLIFSMLSISLIWFVTEKTNFGLALKAVSQDMDMAESVAIDSKKLIFWAFAFGSAFAGLAGLLVGAYFNSVYPAMGDVPAYKSLAIIVVGGMSNIWGAFWASLLIGLLETLSMGIFNIPLPRDSLAFIFMVLVLMFNPQGIMSIFKRN
jgi:branched-chain amino acid transport system permease protein